MTTYADEIALKNGVNNRHRSLLLELAAGATYSEAAARTGYSLGRVRQLVQAELFQNELRRIQDEVEGKFTDEAASSPLYNKEHARELLEGEVENSIKTIVGLRDQSESDAVRRRSAADLLDRAGFTAAKAPTDLAVITVEVGEGLAHMLKEASAAQLPVPVADDTIIDGEVDGEVDEANKE